jgi:hypothetical protein
MILKTGEIWLVSLDPTIGDEIKEALNEEEMGRIRNAAALILVDVGKRSEQSLLLGRPRSHFPLDQPEPPPKNAAN